MGDDKKLPDNVISITTLSINRSKRKHCTCDNPKYEIDTANHEVICKNCRVVVDPFDALLEIANNWDRFRADVNYLLEQRKQIVNYKPWLLGIKNIERNVGRRGEMLPCCPHCHKAMFLEEINSYTNKDMETVRRRLEGESD